MQNDSGQAEEEMGGVEEKSKHGVGSTQKIKSIWWLK